MLILEMKKTIESLEKADKKRMKKKNITIFEGENDNMMNGKVGSE